MLKQKPSYWRRSVQTSRVSSKFFRLPLFCSRTHLTSLAEDEESVEELGDLGAKLGKADSATGDDPDGFGGFEDKVAVESFAGASNREQGRRVEVLTGLLRGREARRERRRTKWALAR